MALERYKSKRDFTRTPEPVTGRSATGDTYVIQKHAARRLHYDLRLELDGVLKSWAVTNGPSLVVGEKRLAVETEDHPLDYAGFEGAIPKGEYGGGEVIVWDRGRWEPVGDPRRGLAKGHLRFQVHGEKLSGLFDLVRLKPRARERTTNWLLIKARDEHARGESAPDILTERPESVVSDRSVEALARSPTREWRTRAQKPTRKERAAPKRTVTAPARKPARKTATGGAKLPAFVPPQLATLVAKAPSGPGWVHEIKYDGYRLQARIDRGRVRLHTRSGLDWTDKFRPIAEACAALPLDLAVLDGELIVDGADGRSSFSDLQAEMKAGHGDRLIYVVFDLLHLDGEDTRGRPLSERQAGLAGVLSGVAPPLRLSEVFEADGEAMRRHACRLGFEGIVSKRLTAAYASGRNGDWLKAKCANRQEFVVVGYVPSTTSRQAVGSLALALPEGEGFRFIGKVGTGFTVKSAHAIKAELTPLAAPRPTATWGPDADVKAVKWVEPKLVAEVEFRAWTGGGHLRHASFRGLRADKAPTDIVAEMPMDAPTGRPGKPRSTTAKAAPKPKTGRKPKASSKAAGTGPEGSARSRVRLTHPDRVLWDDAGVTKQGLADYYAAIWPHIAPHVADRPLALVRCPDGANGSCFFQKHAWAGLDEALVTRHTLGADHVLAVHDPDGLMALAQAAVLEIHPWGSTLTAPDCPDRLIFDLDPGEGVTFTDLEAAARELRTRLAAVDLTSFVKTSGGKGLHVVAPVRPETPWEEAKAFTRGIAEAMAREDRRRFTAKLSKATRTGRIFVDYLRNGRGATAVAAFSPRARPGAPVSTPLFWEELGTGLSPAQFTLTTIFRRLDALERDPWAGFDAARAAIPTA